MTQPRALQIKSVNARYSVLEYTVSPPAASSSLSAGSFPYAPGGAAEAVPARVRGTVISPIPILAGDTFSVRVDGAPAVNVVLAGTDTTVGRIALKVNAALGSAVGSYAAGYLALTSPTSGADSSLVLGEVTPGVLAKLGMTPGTYAGADAATGGLVTLSADGLGGVAPIATDDGRNLVTDGGELLYVRHITGTLNSTRRLIQQVPGGVPITGRVTYDGSNVVVSYYAKYVPRRQVYSLGAFFSLLDGTDTLTLTVNGQGFSTTFPSGPYTRDQVVDRINDAYASARGIGGTDGKGARIDGTVPGPFTNLFGTVFSIQVDGGAQQDVYFSDPSTITATQVAAFINAETTGLTAEVVTDSGGHEFISIKSDNTTVGRTSSLRVFPGSEPNGDFSSGKALAALGMRAGLYAGCYVAKPYGPDEIEIFSAYRGTGVGSSPEVSIAGSAQTLARMGLTAGLYGGYTTADYVPVTSPFVIPNEGVFQDYKVLLCYPSVLEFGEVPQDADVALQEYMAKSGGSNINEMNRTVFAHGDGRITSGTTNRGFFDAGKPYVMNPDGIIPPDAGGAQISLERNADLNDIVQQIVRVDASDVVQATVGARFETPGSGSNTGTPSAYMRFYADPDDSFTERGFRYYIDPSVIALSIEDNPPGSTVAEQSFLGLRSGRSLFSIENELRLADANTVVADQAGGGVRGYLPLSSATPGFGDQFFRLSDVPATSNLGNLTTYSVLRSLNSRFTVYVGDGTDSFGDFSGTDAISKAVAFLATQPYGVCHIYVKPGVYTETSTVDLNVFTDVIIEGASPASASSAASSVTINFSHANAGFSSTTVLNSFKIKNVRLNHTTLGQNLISVHARQFELEGCRLNSLVTVYDPNLYKVSRTYSYGTTAAAFAIWYTDAVAAVASPSYSSVTFTDSAGLSGQNHPFLALNEIMTTLQVRLDLTIERCVFNTGNVSVTGNVIDSTDGIGLIGINPSSDAFSSMYAAGLVIDSIMLRQLQIYPGLIGTSGTYGPSAIYITPTGTTGTIGWVYGTDPAARVEKVTIEDVVVDIITGGSFTSGFRVPPVIVGGVGIPYQNSPNNVESGGALTVRNLSVRANGGRNAGGTGAGMNAIVPFFSDYSGSSSVGIGDVSDIGLIGLSGQRVNVQNIGVDGTISRCAASSFFVEYYESFTLDGYAEAPRVGGSTTTSSRFRIRELFVGTFDVKNVRMTGPFSSDTWWSNGCVVIEGMSNTRGPIRKFSNFYMYGFQGGSSGSAYLLVSDIGRSDPLYPKQSGGVEISNGYIGMLQTHLATCGLGILVTISATTSDYNSGNVIIRGVVIDDCILHGISMFTANQTKDVTVEFCDVRYTGNGLIGSGVRSVANRTTTAQGVMRFLNNFAGYNNTYSGALGGYDRVQFNIRDTSLVNQCAFYGNWTYSGGGFNAFSSANLTYSSTTTLFSLSPSSSFDIAVLGAETGYTGQVGAFAGSGAGKIWSSSFHMIHNKATLVSSTTNTE